jgi:deazaflavin-dependent oxidoreductase (nitroreductase family)
MAREPTATALDRWMAQLLTSPRASRLPIALFRAGLGFLFGPRLVMIEHRGRVSNRRRFVMVECVDRLGATIRVASGFGEQAQWYRNIAANGIAYITSGRRRRVRVTPRMLSREESDRALEEYAGAHPTTWRHLSSAIRVATGHDPDVRLIDLVPVSRAG